tara:strand:+ start:118 stop:423 length:306 start_codon:yes stop_codon:yes gene_type:complete
MLKNIDLLKYWTDLSVEKRQYATIFITGIVVFWFIRKSELKEIAHRADLKEVEHNKAIEVAKVNAKLDACNESRIEDMRMWQDLYFETQQLKQKVNENLNN